MSEVYITGIGFVKVAEHWNKSLKVLAYEAIQNCLKECNYKKPDLIIVSNSLGSFIQHQESLSNLIAENLSLNKIPNLRIETGEASGASALMVGYMAIASGMFKNVLIVGVEKLSDALPYQFTSYASSFLDYEYFAYNGITPASIFAILYKLYLKRYNAKQENIAQFASHDHKMAIAAEHAQYRFYLPVERILASPILVDPIRVFESYPISDGAASVMLSSKDQVENKDYSVKLEMISATTDVNILYREDMLLFSSLRDAFYKIRKHTKIELKDIDFLEIYDPYTIASPIILESLGFLNKGEGYKLLLEGQHEKDGELPLNTHGGLKARGHPLGATTLYQVCESVLQLRDKAYNQVPNANIGLIHSMNNIGDQSILILLKRP
jgi:acetyl-CoA C-acetyltransferase